MNKGVIFGVLSALFFSMYALINRYVFSEYDVDTINYVITVGLVYGALGAVSLMKEREFSKFSDKKFKHIIYLSFIATAALSLFIYAQSKTTASNASVISSLVILSTAFWAWLLLRESHTKKALVWMCLMIGATYVALAGFSAIRLNGGDVLVIVSVALFGVNNAYSKKIIPRFGGRYIANVRLIISALLLGLFGLVRSGVSDLLVTEAGAWPLIAGVLAYTNIVLTFKAMEYMKATNALVLNLLHVVATLVGAAVFLGEDMNALRLIAAGSIVFSAYNIFRVGGNKKRV